MKNIIEARQRHFNFSEFFSSDNGANQLVNFIMDYVEKVAMYVLGTDGNITVMQGLDMADTGGMDVQINDGACFTPDDVATTTNMRFAVLVQQNVTVPTADATNPRKDIILARYERVLEFTTSVPQITNENNIVSNNLPTQSVHKLVPYVKEGTPAGSPVPPGRDLGYQGFIASTIDWGAFPTVDLSLKYKIRLGFVGVLSREIDLRGATPSTTALAEIVAKINAAFTEITNPTDGIGDVLTITDVGNAKGSSGLILTTPSLSGNTNVDATDIIFGGYVNTVPPVAKIHTNTNVYQINCPGLDDSFKIGEITIAALQTVLGAGDIFDVYETGSWESDGLENEVIISPSTAGSLEHSTLDPIDHPDGSVTTIKLRDLNVTLGKLSLVVQNLLSQHTTDIGTNATNIGNEITNRTNADNAIIADLPFRNRVVVTASGNWVAPAGVNKVFIVLKSGGGGGGGNETVSTRGGGGGGEGGTVREVVAVTPAVSYPVTIGAGGSAGVGDDFNGGGDGGDSIAFGFTANGGKGGNWGGSTNALLYAPGGRGGFNTGGDGFSGNSGPHPDGANWYNLPLGGGGGGGGGSGTQNGQVNSGGGGVGGWNPLLSSGDGGSGGSGLLIIFY